MYVWINGRPEYPMLHLGTNLSIWTVISTDTAPIEVPKPVDGVHRLPSTSISVVISGGGIGGLFFALEAYRQGRDVVAILERAPGIEALGDTFGLLPPALSTLRYYPQMKEQFERESYNAEMSVWRYEGRPLTPSTNGEWNAPGAVYPARGVYVPWIERRSNIVNMLHEQCQRALRFRSSSTIMWLLTPKMRRKHG